MNRVMRKLLNKYVLFSLGFAIMIACVTTPSYATDRMLRLEPPELHGGDSQPSRGMKICLVVKDARYESEVKLQMCGLKERTDRGGGSIDLLENQETLVTILAYTIADSLEYAGYEVVKVYPARPDKLSAEPRDMPKDRKKDVGLAIRSHVSRSFPVTTDNSGNESSDREITFNRISGSMSAQGGEGWAGGADAVLEVTVNEFSGGRVFNDFPDATQQRTVSLGWSRVTMRVAPDFPGQRSTMFKTNAIGRAGVPWQLVWKESRLKSELEILMNQFYKALVDDVESVLLSDAFFDVVNRVGGSKKNAEAR